jgi:hypothetical protein
VSPSLRSADRSSGQTMHRRGRARFGRLAHDENCCATNGSVVAQTIAIHSIDLSQSYRFPY